MTAGEFVWYELVARDPAAAADFYADVVGWAIETIAVPGMDYRVGMAGDRRMVGIMPPPPGPPADAPGAWYGYVGVDDVDAAADAAAQGGGGVRMPPTDIPGVGRFAIVADPAGGVFMPFRGQGDPAAALPDMTPGTIGWHELFAAGDWQAVWPFYERLFGWAKGDALDMGAMGTYQLIRIAGRDRGAMMTAPTGPSRWRYYFAVDDIDAAAARLTTRGGTIDMGPMAVPGGAFVVHATDPQATPFALIGMRGG